MDIKILKANIEDFPEIWEIFQLIVKPGDTVSFPPDITIEEAKKYWMSDGMYAYKAMLDGIIVGTYVLSLIFQA